MHRPRDDSKQQYFPIQPYPVVQSHVTYFQNWSRDSRPQLPLHLEHHHDYLVEASNNRKQTKLTLENQVLAKGGKDSHERLNCTRTNQIR
ncbi:Uncharacterised protein [Streptococcus pneumoniae]|nr:Uncharacterised protein [Streptococcus pneumoniae]CIW21676.1 Uncharacterised protein [Streptococcus pneumoniae]